MAKKSEKAEGGGLTIKSFGGGLNKSRYTKGAGVPRVELKQGDSVKVQFIADIDDEQWWKEIDQHQFQDKGWKYVPCLGEGCPLCEDEDRDVSKINYRFFTVVYDFKKKELAVLEGPKDLSGRIASKRNRAEKSKKGKFLKTVYEIDKKATTPVSYDVNVEDDKKTVSVDPGKLKAFDLAAYLVDQAKRYFGDDLPTGGKKKKGKGKDKESKKKSALDEDEDYQEDVEYDVDDLMEMSEKDVKAIAKNLGIGLKNTKTGEKRSQKTLAKLIVKKQ